jgi:PLD-like domain
LFYSQPLAIRFGTELLRHVDQVDRIDPYWDTLDIAVAWVRASGMAHLSDRLANFLEHGGRLSVVVGIDLQNTTREGLQALLDLERHGWCETFVYHNEAGSIFHPKLYLFRNEEEARLIVGSNNITESGLYVNVEAGLQVDTNVNSTVIAQTLDALSSWKDTTSRLAVRLDNPFLARLISDGYLPDEATARAQQRRERAAPAPRDATVVCFKAICRAGSLRSSSGRPCRATETRPGPGYGRRRCSNGNGSSDAPEKGLGN